MADWITKLDDFLRLSDRDILSHAGRIFHDDAKEKAEIKFETYRQQQPGLSQPVDTDFDQVLNELKRIEEQAKE
ncbi:MAG: virulence RhuM family protein [Rhodopirellula sp.]|nr:virulence RhuM family protein [Rhodopirellula sp.]